MLLLVQLQPASPFVCVEATQRFGPLPDDIAVMVANAGPAQLQDWAKAVIDARSLDQIFPRH